MRQYKLLLDKVLNEGEDGFDEHGNKVKFIFGDMKKYPLLDGFPAVTERRVPLHGAKTEFIGFINGHHNNNWFAKHGCKFWEHYTKETHDTPIELKGRPLVTVKQWDAQGREDTIARLSCDEFLTLYNDTIMNLSSIIDEWDYRKRPLIYELFGVWATYMSRSYNVDHPEYNSNWSVVSDWHDFRTFSFDVVNNLRNSYHANLSIGDSNIQMPVLQNLSYELSLAYYNATYVCPESLMWLSKDEVLEYTTSDSTGPDLTRYRLTNGDLGPIYGKQIRHWGHGCERIDQLKLVMKQLTDTPSSRSLLVSHWNVGELDKMSIKPCHVSWQLGVRTATLAERLKMYHILSGDELVGDLDNLNNKPDDELRSFLDNKGIPCNALDCHIYQRSLDLVIGYPVNIAYYAYLVESIAYTRHFVPGNLFHSVGNAHIYEEHLEAAKIMLGREERPLPRLTFGVHRSDITQYTHDDLVVINYEPHPPMAIRPVIRHG